MVAMVSHSINHPEQKETALANARLITASPDLLEALMKLEEGFANEAENGLWDADYILDQIIRPAIAKAEGRAH